MADQLVYVYGGSSRLHIAVRHAGELLTNERCNLDDVGEDRVVVDSLEEIEPGRERCERCFRPDVEGDDVEGALA